MKKSLLVIISVFCLSFAFTLNAQEYRGSETCKLCHSSSYNDWKTSGHPYKLQKLQNSQPPSYPEGLSAQKTVGPNVNYTIQPGVPKPPKGYSWDQIGWVLGGYHSNARFIDTEGYVIIGDSTRYHIPTDRWVQYDQTEPGKKTYSYSCYKCHTTGASTEKTAAFQPYPGIEGSWAEPGVGCEACHGPGSGHVSNPSNKPPKEGLESCNQCHARDRGEQYAWNYRVEWIPAVVSGVSTGFIRHREQGDMMHASKHGKAGFTCATCHNPHKSVYYELGGLKDTPSCESCHQNKTIPGHTSAACNDCHMPFVAKNADHFTPYVSEQSAHFWNIITDPIAGSENVEQIGSAYFMKVDSEGISGITLDYTCLQCHVNQDVQWAAQYAKDIHDIGVSVDGTDAQPTGYGLAQNYPNPFNPSTEIQFSLPQAEQVNLSVYTITGALVTQLVNEFMSAGQHSVAFNAIDLASGIYVYRISAGNFVYSRKMLLLK